MVDIYRHDVFMKGHRKGGDINFGLISKVLGILLLVEAGLFLICAGVSLYYHESDYIYFIYTTLINVVIGIILFFCGKGSDNQMSRRDGYCIVSVSWLLFTIFGMLPFYLSGYIPSITDAFFETMSGFTTTGATILDDVESLSYGLLFWRSFTQWIGGLGIVLFTIAILPLFSGSTQQLFLSEATGVTHEKIQPKTSVMARRLWMIYIILTLLEALLLMCGGMNFFDAICHSFTTTATGGFSTKQNGISYWNSSYIEYVISFFMILSGINFALYYSVVKGHFKNFFKDDELRWFLKSVGTITIIIMIALLINNHYDLEKSFRKAIFQVASAHTSCGFATDDYNLWPPFTWMLLLFSMISGGCTGSTSGGVKNLRILIIFQNIKNQFRQMIHPRAVLPVRVSETTITSQVSAVVFTFFATYLICIFVGWTLLMSFGVGLTESMSSVISAIGNVGPGLGKSGPIYSWSYLPDAAKWVLSALMLIGRLEIFGILLLFYRRFWQDKF
jgi:trk system potassium uptake protein